VAVSHFSFSSQVRPICQIGMSTTRQAEPSSWLDVSCHVHEAELFRGRERFNDRFEPGTASVTFANDTGWADLGGTYADVAAAELRPGRQIRIGVWGPWTAGTAPFTRWLYRGYIDQATPAYDPTLHDIVTVNCIDALGEAGTSTAPQGAHQGVNETVSQRINRVLDAVGWWGTKRKIAATTTTVQGTSLGTLAIDHLGQAADSAGGVVFGDLDGDVVFRDIDWMLYDPDVPPDGDIGPGDPGVPPGDLPPYVDPTPGPVYDPDDPPAEHPPKVCVCADGTDGTLVEKGDNYRLYVRDGHLFYEASGTTWDLGPYSGGCTCVDPDGPERSDDPDEDGDYEISPFPPIELPPQFGVELLAWNDGGLADPPAAAVTVAGVTPGHDCLLVVLVNALGTDTNTTGLAPVVTGGDLDWGHRRDADQSADGASSFIVIAPVGRDDPGTFSVTATWTAGMTSRSHIVTVWKVTSPVGDYLERFDAGVVLYATTDSDPPDEIEPGDGPHIVELAADRTPAGIEALTRTVDITIAQSLAEEAIGPFGAILADGDGPWNYPDNAPPQPEPVLRDIATVVLADDFERANGPLGSNWPAPTTIPANPGTLPGPLAISGGGVILPTTNTDGYAFYVDPITGDHFIEIEISNWKRGATTRNANIDLYTCVPDRVNLTFAGSYHTRWIIAEDDTGGWVQGGVGAMTNQFFIMPADTFRMRVESTSGGTVHRMFIDDVFTYEQTTTAIVGSYVGFQPYWNGSGSSPRIESASVGTVSDRVRKTSWVAGWRVGVASPRVMLEDVNTGDDDIQSAQACLVVESAETEAGWRILGYDLAAALSAVTPAGTLAFDNTPRPGSLVAVLVGVTATTDVIDSVTVTGADFTRAVVQHKTGSSWGQGAVFTAVAPLDLVADSWNVVVTHPAVESISAVVYEVAAPADTAPVGATASGVLGTNTAGSVNGADSITLSATGDATAVVLAYLHVAADPDPSSGATTVDGDEWHEEYQSSTGLRAYFQTMSRAPGQPESTSTDVHWADVQTGTADTYSAVQLAVEIKPGGLTTGAGSGVWLGGLTDPWNGTISTAGAFDPDGNPIWEFP